MGVRLSLVLPAFNEQAGIRQSIAEADEALARLCDDYEILVVDDGSADDTSSIVNEEVAQRPQVRLLRHEVNRGYGAALRTGFESARFDLVAFTDADCQFFLDDLNLLFPHSANHPVVVGYRVDRKDLWRRRFLSKGYNLIARTLLGTTVRDIDCALKVFHREALAQILPESNGFFVNTEMLTRARQQGLSVAEVGVRHRPRLRGQSTVSLREVPKTLARLLPFWWTEVMFGQPHPPNSPPRSGGGLGGWGLVLLLACLLFFVRLRAPLLEPQEARYAEIPRLMLVEGRFVVPTLHEQDYLDKPPLLYWCVMASYRLFGVHDWAARVVPGLAGVLTALVTYWWGRRAFGSVAGLCGAVLLCLTPEFIYRGRMLTFDTLLMLWVVSTLATAHVALMSGHLRWRWWILSACACGLGLLTKGPIAFALVVPPLVAVGWLDTRLARIGWSRWLAFVGIAMLIASPWYLAMMTAQPNFAETFLWKHHVERFLTPFDHSKPAWFYLPGLALGLLPWTLLLPVLGRNLLDRSGQAARQRPAALGLVLACFVCMLLFFSASGCKRPTYLLPALPPLALALGWMIAHQAPDWRRLLSQGSRLSTATASVLLVFGVGLTLTAALTQTVRPAQGFTLAAIGLVTLALIVGIRRLSWATTGALAFVTLFIGVRELLPAYNDQFSLRGQLRREAGLPEQARRPVVCYPQRYDSVTFYLPGVPVRVFGKGETRELLEYLEAHPETLVVIKSGKAYRDLVAGLPANLTFRTKNRRGAVVVGRVESERTKYEAQR